MLQFKIIILRTNLQFLGGKKFAWSSTKKYQSKKIVKQEFIHNLQLSELKRAY
jgi:hypothetical protein